MEKITQEISIATNKERFQKLKKIKQSLEEPNITNKLASKLINDLLQFPEVTAKEINVKKNLIIVCFIKHLKAEPKFRV